MAPTKIRSDETALPEYAKQTLPFAIVAEQIKLY